MEKQVGPKGRPNFPIHRSPTSGGGGAPTLVFTLLEPDCSRPAHDVYRHTYTRRCKQLQRFAAVCSGLQ
eukprot:10896087-Alexandrium_andersonii.AAC.1